MCAVSMIMNDWQHPTWPNPNNPNTPGPNSIPWPTIQADPLLAAQMLEVLKRLEAIDARLGLLEQCKFSEPEKEQIKSELLKIAKKKKRKKK